MVNETVIEMVSALRTIIPVVVALESVLISYLLIKGATMGENEDVPDSGTKDKESDAKIEEGSQ